MSWKDLLAVYNEVETIAMPFIGKRHVYNASRQYEIRGKLPKTLGWYAFEVGTDKYAKVKSALDSDMEDDEGVWYTFDKGDWPIVEGYVVHDILVDFSVNPNDVCQIDKFITGSNVINFPPPVDIFTMVNCLRLPTGELVYIEESPNCSGKVRQEVFDAYVSGKDLEFIKGVTPVLSFAFVLAKRLQDIKDKEIQARLEAIQREDARQMALESMGTVYGRRMITRDNFEVAAKSAVEAGGAKFISSRTTYHEDQMAVRFSVEQSRIECTCHRDTLRIIDSGVCLTDESTGENYDTTLSLESLPSVIKQARDQGVLVVWRT